VTFDEDAQGSFSSFSRSDFTDFFPVEKFVFDFPMTAISQGEGKIDQEKLLLSISSEFQRVSETLKEI
jgi:hypothetical protein